MAHCIMVVSDLHYETEFHKGVDESKALSWLKKLVNSEKPDVLIGLGDWGHAWTLEDWRALLCRVKVYGVYGNHENLELLKSLHNSDGTSVLQQDGQTKTIEGLKFGFINGIISHPPKPKEGVPRKSSSDFLEVAKGLVGVDVLCTHESPMLSEYENRVTLTVGLQTARQVAEIVHPDLYLSGHLHLEAYTISKIGNTTALRVDSSQQERHYALIKPEKQLVCMCNDSKVVAEQTISFNLQK